MEPKMTKYLKVSTLLTVTIIAVGITNCQDKSKKVDAASSSCPADFIKDYNENYLTIQASMKDLKTEIEKKTMTCKSEINSFHKQSLTSCDALVKKYDKLDCVTRKTEGGESEKMTTAKLKSQCAEYKKLTDSTVCTTPPADPAKPAAAGSGQTGDGKSTATTTVDPKKDLSKFAETSAGAHSDILKNLVGVWSLVSSGQSSSVSLVQFSAEKGFGQAVLEKTVIENPEFKGIQDSAFQFKHVRVTKEIPAAALIAADISVNSESKGFRIIDLSTGPKSDTDKTETKRSLLVRLYLAQPDSKRMDVVTGDLVNGVYKFDLTDVKTFVLMEKKPATTARSAESR